MIKQYTVELSELAIKQLARIDRYIAEELQNPAAAERVLERLETEMGKLSSMPERVALVDDEPWRTKKVHKYIVDNYIVYFIVDEVSNKVLITAVVLGLMDQNKQLSKMIT